MRCEIDNWLPTRQMELAMMRSKYIRQFPTALWVWFCFMLISWFNHCDKAEICLCLIHRGPSNGKALWHQNLHPQNSVWWLITNSCHYHWQYYFINNYCFFLLGVIVQTFRKMGCSHWWYSRLIDNWVRLSNILLGYCISLCYTIELDQKGRQLKYWDVGAYT